jgi:hypothetical protein
MSNINPLLSIRCILSFGNITWTTIAPLALSIFGSMKIRLIVSCEETQTYYLYDWDEQKNGVSLLLKDYSNEDLRDAA